jgi:hypothetical protein
MPAPQKCDYMGYPTGAATATVLDKGPLVRRV